MLIACKYEEMYIPTVEDFVYITDGTYTTQQVLEMVRKLELIINIRYLTRGKIKTTLCHLNVIFFIGTSYPGCSEFQSRPTNRYHFSKEEFQGWIR